MSEQSRDAGYDEFVESVAEGEGYYLECPEGHGSLPPRRVCPTCGATELSEQPLPDSGTIDTYTVVHVGTPDFEADTPYVTAVASFGPVRLTGVVRGVEPDEVETGLSVGVGVEERETTGEPLLTFRPR